MIGFLIFCYGILIGISLVACSVVGLVMSLKERKKGLPTKAGVPIAFIALMLLPILLIGLCVGVLIYANFSAAQYEELDVVSSNLGVDVSEGTVVEYWDTRGWFGDGEVYAEIAFADDSFEEMLAEDSVWYDLPMRGTIRMIPYGGEDWDGDYWSPFITDAEGHRLIPKTENGYYYFSNPYGDGWDLYEEDEFFYTNFTFALYDADTRTLYFYLYNS